VTVLFETGRIDLWVAILSEGGASLEGRVSSGLLIPRKEECPQAQLDDALREKLCLAYPIVYLLEFLIRRDTCLDFDAGQKLSTTKCHLQVQIYLCYASTLSLCFTLDFGKFTVDF